MLRELRNPKSPENTINANPQQYRRLLKLGWTPVDNEPMKEVVDFTKKVDAEIQATLDSAEKCCESKECCKELEVITQPEEEKPEVVKQKGRPRK